jgi:hypothetical protein
MHGPGLDNRVESIAVGLLDIEYPLRQAHVFLVQHVHVGQW